MTMDGTSMHGTSSAADEGADDKMKVVVRLRPLPEGGSAAVVAADEGTVEFAGAADEARAFRFDYVFGTDARQEEVFDYVAEEMLDQFFTGYNSTILAYGQTGSGKSYTMFGPPGHRGLIPRICQQIFERIGLLKNCADIEYVVSVSFLEIYLEKVYDLLGESINKASSPKKNSDKRASLTVHESNTFGVYVEGATIVSVSDGDELLNCIHLGEAQRYKGSTDMNLESSRSHAIVKINLLKRDNLEGNIQKSDLFLVDLAGSEKVAKTNAVGATLEEAKKINLSLSSLGNVINALTQKEKRTHIPYRDSQLTRLLRDSLGGNSKTTLILNCACDKSNESETLTTLRFGSRAKHIKNKAIVNKSDLFLKKKLERKIAQLEKKEQDYKTRIELLEHEVKELQATASHRPLPEEVDLLAENTKLRAQVDSLKVLLNPRTDSLDTEQHISVDDLLTKLMEKCELVVELQSRLDDQADKEKALKKLMTDLKHTEAQLVEKNHQLAEQLAIAQLDNLNLTNENMTLSKDIATIHRISKTRAERIQVLESTVRELSDMRLGNDLSLPSAFEAIKEVNEPSSALSPTSLGWWGVFGPSRRSSTGSVHSGGLAKIPSNETRRSRKTGFNLHVVKASVPHEAESLD
ncbi:ADR145Cp [Eremothecium gossypii ATCC 10895]|uniref:ADR145Cp n=1 Tax=Eremothecium gossypii (strain ATCC 10895 / CBS 109.51 / FGSC 9923 / NRRL Y-1056) TaxID=284811 RepID=Q759X8_EREGS|nr:ADR145Cp [Eremothecium gossypii ATCC 10895]AAS52065.1 ADR145Cp [Eremothecium gossypii ATCC 10895]AEY96364.1 FADR145Cp [Eremothecium gossypii FDAG1]